MPNRLSSERLESKPYCKVIDIAITASGNATGTSQVAGGSVITLEDSNSNVMDCNWVEVTFVTSATTEGYGWVQPINSAEYNTTGTKNNVGSTLATGAGALGMTAHANQKVRMDFHTGYIDEISLCNIFGVPVRAFINYGKAVVSTLRSDRAGDGGE